MGEGAVDRMVEARGGGAAGRLVRPVLLLALLLSTALPFATLLLWSVSGRWLFPSLLPAPFSLEGWEALAGGGAFHGALGTSLALGLLTALGATAVALPVARALARTRGPVRWIGAAAAFLPVAAPPVALGVGLQVLLLALGLGGTFAGVLAAHLVPSAGYLTLVLLGAFTLHDDRAEEAARTLGASRWQTLRRVTLPMLRAPIVEGASLAFLVSWTQFALTLVVGAGAVRTLPLEVYAYVRAGEDRAAAVGAVLLVLPVVGALAALRWATRRAAVVPG